MATARSITRLLSSIAAPLNTSSRPTPVLFKPTRFLLSSSYYFPSPGLVASNRFTHRSSGDSSSTRDWTPPLIVDDFDTMTDQAFLSEKGGASSDKRHWLVIAATNGFQFAKEKPLYDFYVKTLASVVGSEEKAKKKIYFVSCGPVFGFGVEIDEDTKNMLQGDRRVLLIYEDYYYDARNKDPSVRSPARFTPVNHNHRLDNIFSYHHLSERNLDWRSDHWLINIKEPDGGFTTISEAVIFCIKVLAEVVGSEEAKKKIYIIWFKLPCGFAAEIDKDTSIKLKGLPDVLKVLPDYAFDVKFNRRKTLFVRPP